MKRQLLHTPEGVRDIYDAECGKKRVLKRKLHDLLNQYGYHSIETPSFEFFDIFSRQIGTTPSRDLYKFFDREGNTLVLRPEITPSVARCAAKYFMEDELPIRLCYVGNTFINNSSYQGRLKESTQLGAELIGESSVDADAEIIALTVELLKRAGLREFKINIGHVEFLEGLMDACNMAEDDRNEIRELLSNKNFFGVEEYLSGMSLEQDMVSLFAMLKDYMLTPEKIREAKKKAGRYGKVYYALDQLEKLDGVLKLYGVSGYISYELGVVSKYDYYTGIIFAGYTFGSGEAIVTGGRYDNLLGYFGKNAAAIGFAIVIDQLMSALTRQNIEIPYENRTKWIVYAPERHADAIGMAQSMRAKGDYVELMRMTGDMDEEVYRACAGKKKIRDIIYIR